MTLGSAEAPGLFLLKEERGVWPPVHGRGQGSQPGESQDLPLLFPVPPSPSQLPHHHLFWGSLIAPPLSLLSLSLEVWPYHTQRPSSSGSPTPTPHPIPKRSGPACLTLSTHPSTQLLAFSHTFSSCSHEPDPPPSFGNTSPIALTFSHRDKDSHTPK